MVKRRDARQTDLLHSEKSNGAKWRTTELKGICAICAILFSSVRGEENKNSADAPFIPGGKWRGADPLACEHAERLSPAWRPDPFGRHDTLTAHPYSGEPGLVTSRQRWIYSRATFCLIPFDHPARAPRKPVDGDQGPRG